MVYLIQITLFVWEESMGKTSWMISDDVSNLVTMLQSRSDVAWTMTLGELPSYLDLYVYFNIEMAIVLFQCVSCAAMPSRTLNSLSVVTVGSISGVFVFP